MRVIHKLHLKASSNMIMLPPGAIILTAMMQYGFPTLWFITDDEQIPTEQRIFRVFGTGEFVPEYYDKSNYIATVIDAVLVWHIFEEERG